MLTPLSFEQILNDYKPDNSLFSEESPEINTLKNIIFNNLDEVEKRVILLYAECGNFRKLGKELGVCASTARTEIIKIRKKIYAYYINTSSSTTHYR